MFKGFKSSRRILYRNLAIFFAILGPGLITGSVDNDAGGITTYSVAGALYGYNMIWTLIPSFIVLIVIQEMNARMGIVTGKGLADLIRENSGLKITFFIFVGLLIADIGNSTTEFAGIAGSMEVLGISKYISVPISGIAVWLLVVKGNYKIAERVFILFSLALFMYIISALMGNPNWGEIGTSIVKPQLEMNTDYLAMVIGIVGTTIAPWMQFYMQSSVIEKGIKVEKYKFVLVDIVIGCIATVVVAFFIIVACAATMHPQGIIINEAKDAALALQPLAGKLASVVFSFGLFIASIFSATILPLATAFYVCEAFGFEAGIDKKWKEAPEFFILYTGILVISMIIILIPGAPLIRITILSQILNGILLPVVLVSMMLIVNSKKVMGEYTNKMTNNIIGWVAVVILIALTIMLLIFSIFT
jgi:NRAMP (natural resistance-associated macrophage protein)-like metal ion transporter